VASLFLEEEEVKVRWSFVCFLGVFFWGGGGLWVEGIHTHMGRKEEKGMESTQQEGEKGETMQVVEVTTHDDDDRAGETGHRSKDEDEEALARVEEMRKSAEAKRALRQANLAPERPGKSLFLPT
jgi:hypothetical protein